MSQHCSIICSPNHDDRFLLCSSRSIRLWQTSSNSASQSPTDQILTKDVFAQKLKERQLHDATTAFAWYPTNDGSGSPLASPDHLVAVGDINGRVTLISLQEVNPSVDFGELHKLEFVPRQPRPTSFLHWNPFRKNILAQGLERSRNTKESTILLWDVTEPIVSRDGQGLVATISRAVGVSGPAPTVVEHTVPVAPGTYSRPFAEFAPGEVVSSFAWISASSFVAGLGGKYLRIFELPSVMRETINTKAVHGLCFDRNSKNLIASYYGSQTMVWMLRKMDRPVSVFSLGHDRQVLQIAWCPTRSGYLSVLGKDARSVLVFDTMHLSLGGNTDDISQCMMERRVAISAAGSPHHLVSLAWLPSMVGALLCVDASGQLFLKQLLEHVTVGFSPAENKIFWARGTDMGETSGPALERDISHEMRGLALRNYGFDLDKSVSSCAALFPEDDHRHEMWQWLEHFCALVRPLEPSSSKSRTAGGGSFSSNASSSRSLSSTSSTPPASTSPYLLGVRGTLSMASLASPQIRSAGPAPSFCQRSETVEAPWHHSGPAESLPARVVNWQFRSDERTRILRLCQLGHETVVNTIDTLRNGREFERAACLALIHLDFSLAIDILRRGAEYQQRHLGSGSGALSGLNLELIALALTGFSDERNRVWHGVTKELLPRLQHPYLRLMFMFIAAENADDLENCTNVAGIRVADRIALAALYLSDNKLRSFVDQLTCECIGKASLEGLILTGLGSECLELLQSYLDRTGDIQTVSLVCMLGLRLKSGAMREDKRPNSWASAYRDLLDGWRLWSHRANFDIQRQVCDPSYRAPPQIYVACGFCGGKVAHAGQPGGTAASRRYQNNTSAAYGKTSICQSCRKPLPRCAVCLMHTGTAAGMLGAPGPGAQAAVPVKRWFVWCLKCRHGGHAAHIAAWFKENRDCPVSGCTCTCSDLDRNSLSAVESVGQ